MAEGAERRKVVVVGDSETGKTSLLFRVSNKDMELPQFPPTIMENQVIKYVVMWLVITIASLCLG